MPPISRRRARSRILLLFSAAACLLVPGPADAFGVDRPGGLLNHAHSALQEGNLYEARRFAEEEVRVNPESGVGHLLLGAILYRERNFYYARLAAERALEIDPTSYRSRELLGDIFYQQGVLPQAITEWEKLDGNGPLRPGVEEKKERARRELEAEEEFEEVRSRNFTLRHDGEASPAVIRSVLWQLERSYRALEREFRDAPPGDNIVILYSRRQYHEITSMPRWVGGSYDGKIRIPVGGLESEADAEALWPVLAHELTHAFLRSIVGRRLPLWFEEGLAEHFEARTGAGEQLHFDPGRAAGSHYRSFSDLSAGLLGKSGPIAEAYAESARAVELLIAEEGFGAVRGLVEEMETGLSFAKALEAETEMTMKEFQARVFNP